MVRIISDNKEIPYRVKLRTPSLSNLSLFEEASQGMLLPDDPYSDALATRREGLRQRFVDAGLRLARLHHEAGEPEPSIDVLRRVLAQDAALEPAHQLLMRILAEVGRKSDALRQFGECSTARHAGAPA